MTWGLHRDTADVRAIGLPVFSLGEIPTGPLRLDVRPQDALEFAMVGDWTVGRQDCVLADDDGVLFVPATPAGDVFTRTWLFAISFRSPYAVGRQKSTAHWDLGTKAMHPRDGR